MKKLILLLLSACSCLGSGSVQESNGHVVAPANFWYKEAGLSGYTLDPAFQSAVQAVQIIGGQGGGVTNAWFRSTPTVSWTPVGGTNTFSVPAMTYDDYGQAIYQAQFYSQMVSNSFNWYTTTTNNGNLIWQYTVVGPSVTTTYSMGNLGSTPLAIVIKTNGVYLTSFVFNPSGLLSATSFQGDGRLLTSVDSASIVNLSGTLASNTIPPNLGVKTMTISQPSSALATSMLGLAADHKTVVTNPVPAGSTPPLFISGTNTVFDTLGGSNRFNVPFGIFDLINAAHDSTNNWPWQVYDQPASTVLSNLASYNALGLTNQQVIQYATVQLTNAGLSYFTFSTSANGNTNAILILNTNYVSSFPTTSTNLAFNSTLAGSNWVLTLDSASDLIITNTGGNKASFLFQTNGQFVVGQSGGATLQLGMATNNTPSGNYGNGSFLSTTNGQYYGVSNSAIFQIYMP